MLWPHGNNSIVRSNMAMGKIGRGWGLWKMLSKNELGGNVDQLIGVIMTQMCLFSPPTFSKICHSHQVHIFAPRLLMLAQEKK